MKELQRTYEKPTIVQAGKRQTLSSGRWNHDVITE